MIHVIAFITTQPGRRAEVLAEFAKVIPLVHAEAGCIEYGATVDMPGAGAIQTPLGADSFAVVEKWESLAALKAHGAAEHMKAYAARVGDMLANRVIHVLEPVA